MAAQVSDNEMVALRKLLSGDNAAFQDDLRSLDSEHANIGLSALITGAFVEVVDRILPDDVSDAAIIKLVGELRAQHQVAAEQMTPDVIERLIKNLFGRADLSDVDADTRTGQELLFVGLVVHRSGLAGDELDDFLRRARRNGDALITNAVNRAQP